MAHLIEFQGQGIMPDWGNVFMDRDNHSICREIVKDIKNSYPFSPFRHVKLYRTKGRWKDANIYWKCIHCNFFCELLDQYIIEQHLCRSCDSITIQDQNDLRETVIKRIEKHWIDLNR